MDLCCPAISRASIKLSRSASWGRCQAVLSHLQDPTTCTARWTLRAAMGRGRRMATRTIKSTPLCSLIPTWLRTTKWTWSRAIIPPRPQREWRVQEPTQAACRSPKAIPTPASSTWRPKKSLVLESQDIRKGPLATTTPTESRKALEVVTDEFRSLSTKTKDTPLSHRCTKASRCRAIRRNSRYTPWAISRSICQLGCALQVRRGLTRTISVLQTPKKPLWRPEMHSTSSLKHLNQEEDPRLTQEWTPRIRSTRSHSRMESIPRGIITIPR